ncbi:hypothetical protein ACFY6U_25580 [Streptomyces sp. NPDC013157]|uniref:hypothetical protein n=1 Tax=Streptomyces sp. NPDC013157 TaxID=3364861 RepID=UPI00369F1318
MQMGEEDEPPLVVVPRLRLVVESLSFFELATDQVTVPERNERGPWAVDRDA